MRKTDVSIRLATPADKNLWDKVVRHPLQSWSWGEFRKNMGVDVARLAVIKGEKLIEGWQITFHRIPYTPWTIGYFPKGPAMDKRMIEELMKIGREKRAIFIQMEPSIEAKDTKKKIPLSQYLNILISQYPRLRPSHHPLFPKYTFMLDLTRSEEQLLSAMHPKTRYNIRLAQRHGVKVREDSSRKACEAYVRLSQQTTSRQGFYAHNEIYHRRMWKVMSKTGIAHLFTATYGEKILAAWVVFAFGDTVYYPYGASSRERREVMAPTLILWEIARWAKKQGFKYFDLWGALGPKPKENDPWYGFHRFKQGFSPQLVEFIGSYDLVINPLLYRFYTMADTLRWILLRIRTKLHAQ